MWFCKFVPSCRLHRIGIEKFVQWYINLLGLFNAEYIRLGYYVTHSLEDKGFCIFHKVICPKVNVVARPDFDLAYYDSTDQRFNHYTTRTPAYVVEWRYYYNKQQRVWVVLEYASLDFHLRDSLSSRDYCIL